MAGRGRQASHVHLLATKHFNKTKLNIFRHDDLYYGQQQTAAKKLPVSSLLCVSFDNVSDGAAPWSLPMQIALSSALNIFKWNHYVLAVYVRVNPFCMCMPEIFRLASFWCGRNSNPVLCWPRLPLTYRGEKINPFHPTGPFLAAKLIFVSIILRIL